MALSNSRPQRMLTLCMLYVAQGVPWGFMLVTLPSYLAGQPYNVGPADIGKLTAVILVPWSFKLIWAPLIDTFTIRSLGRRRPWILAAELMMALTLLGFVGLGNPAEQLNLILAMYFIHNCFASLQDVCTDALAVDILPYEEYGQMNGMMWCSKLIGKGVAAWGLAYVLNWGGLGACVAVQMAVLLLIMLVPLFLIERPGEKRFPWSEGQATAVTAANFMPPRETARSLLTAFSLTTTVVFLVFAVSKLVASGINEVVIKTLYAQHLGWRPEEISTSFGLFALAPIILASLAAGVLADRCGARLVLVLGFGGYGLMAMLFAASPQLWQQGAIGTLYIVVCETLHAVGSVGFLAMGMRISWTAACATMFTMYMTLSNVSHVAGNSLAGPVYNYFLKQAGSAATPELQAYEWTFWFVGVVSLLPLLLLPLVRTKEVDEARAIEAAVNQRA